MITIFENLIRRGNRIAVSRNMSNVGRNGGVGGNAAVVLAYACLVHEAAPLVLAGMQAANLA